MFRGMLKNVSQISKISWCPSPPPLKVIGLWWLALLWRTLLK
jgi:hypothetical protein